MGTEINKKNQKIIVVLIWNRYNSGWRYEYSNVLKKSKKTIYSQHCSLYHNRNLLSAGILNTKEIVLSFLVGMILYRIVSMRFLIPYCVGIFHSKLGTQIMIYSTILRGSILIVVNVIIALYW